MEHPLKIETDSNGDFILDAEAIASRFGISPDAMRHHLKRGAVVSVVEKGSGLDDGKSRLSVRLGNRTWRAVVGPDLRILDEEQLWASKSTFVQDANGLHQH